jgi:hypothetical protein
MRQETARVAAVVLHNAKEALRAEIQALGNKIRELQEAEAAIMVEKRAKQEEYDRYEAARAELSNLEF